MLQILISANLERSKVVRRMLMIIIIVTILGLVGPVRATTGLSIYEIQYTTDANGISPQNGNVVDSSAE